MTDHATHTQDCPYATSPLLKSIPNLYHGFFGTRGGVSPHPFESLNGSFGAEDKPENVVENRTRALAALGIPYETPLLFRKQEHTKHVHIIETPDDFAHDAPPVGDGLVTALPNVALGVLTADCGPILWVDPRKRVIGACHAGWKGAFAGILQETSQAMQTLGSRIEDIHVTLGPTIHQESYEVDQVFLDTFLKKNPNHQAFFIPLNNRHFLFDLPGFIMEELCAIGIKKTHNIGIDTFGSSFFSRRRALKKGETLYGCSMSLIMLGSPT